MFTHKSTQNVCMQIPVFFILATQIIINNQFVNNSRKIFLINYKKTVSIEPLWQKKNVHLPKNNIKIEWKLLNLNIGKKNWKLPSKFFLLLCCTSMYLISKDMDVNKINSIGNYFKIQRNIVLIAVLYITVNMYQFVWPRIPKLPYILRYQ